MVVAPGFDGNESFPGPATLVDELKGNSTALMFGTSLVIETAPGTNRVTGFGVAGSSGTRWIATFDAADGLDVDRMYEPRDGTFVFHWDRRDVAVVDTVSGRFAMYVWPGGSDVGGFGGTYVESRLAWVEPDPTSS
jgi:hypothetical protein